VDEAMRRLRESDEIITRISISTGFDNIRTFNRVFKKITGMTPGEFRDLKRDKTYNGESFRN
jgi:two-component system response regulator YesN